MKKSLVILAACFFAIGADIAPAQEVRGASIVAGKQARPDMVGVWKWASGGTLVLKKNNVATHTRWKRSGRWGIDRDGGIVIKSGRRFTFQVTMRDKNTGDVLCLESGARTVIRRR